MLHNPLHKTVNTSLKSSKMKRKFVLNAFLCFLLINVLSRSAAAQTSSAEYSGNSNNDVYRVGIGTMYNIDLRFTHSYLGFNITPNSTGNWRMGTDNAISPTGNPNAGNNGGSMLLGGLAGDLYFVTIPTSNTNVSRSFNNTDLANNIKMTLTRDGKLQVGTTLPNQTLHGDYKLAVAGKIVSQSLYITHPSTWSDYVFSPSYRLRPISELALYIKNNKHLPEVPAASESMADGYDVSQMNARLLQKVEELTLYIIQLNEKIESLEKKN